LDTILVGLRPVGCLFRAVDTRRGPPTHRAFGDRPQELNRVAWLHMFVPDPVSMLLREFGTHTEASWTMAWANLKGRLGPDRRTWWQAARRPHRRVHA